MKVLTIIWNSLLVLFFTLLLSSNSCKKYPPNLSKIPEYQKQWFFIDTGSYYVYTDSANNLDSVYVKKIEFYTWYPKKGNDRQFYLCTLSNPFVFSLKGGVDQISLLRSSGADYLPNIIQVSPPYHANKLYGPGHGFNQIYLDTILPQVTFGINQFDSTFIWHVKTDNILNSDSATYYFSKGVGITRVIDHQRKTDKWLKRYRIVKKLD